MSDPIGDFLVRIKNAGHIGKTSVATPYSKMKFAIAEVLLAKGYINGIETKTKNHTKTLEITLTYENNQPKVIGIQRISKPSRRWYQNAKNIRPFHRGQGLSVFSTPKGVMTDNEARKQNVGGEFLFNIW